MNKGIYTNALPNSTVKTIVIRHGNVSVGQAIGGGVHRTKQPVDCNANGNHAKGNVPKSTKGGDLNDLSAATNKLWNILISIKNILVIPSVIVVVVMMSTPIPGFAVHVRARSRQYSAKIQMLAEYFFLALVQSTFIDVVEGVFTPGDKAALKTAKVTCLSETSVDGSCPIFAAQDGNGVIGAWDVSKVTDMSYCKFATTN